MNCCSVSVPAFDDDFLFQRGKKREILPTRNTQILPIQITTPILTLGFIVTDPRHPAFANILLF